MSLAGAKAVVDFVRYALPLVPAIRGVYCSFVQCRPELGPVPPDLRGIREDEAAVDAELERRRAIVGDDDGDG